jgi:hypothetical protein
MRAFSRSKAVFSVTIVSVAILCGCSKKPQAWYPTPPYPAATGEDFDLTSPKTDLNGSPDDPEWATQLQSSTNYPPVKDSACQKSNQQPYENQCTDQFQHLVQDRGTGLTGLACELFGDPSSINGHVDWTVASAHGSVGFLNFADDWDYNLFLVPFGDAGLTQDNIFVTGTQQRYIEIEFDSRELADRFSTQWWQEFARLATQGAQKGDFTQVENHLHAGNGLALGVEPV